jgi:hypothetical protein
MAVVLRVYAEPYDPKRPKVCCDETSRQRRADIQPALPGHPGGPGRIAYESKRAGTRPLFIHCESQAGWRHVAVPARRTPLDFARQMQWLVDERYPEADVLRVVLDNRNTHGPGALDEAFEPAEAQRLVEKLAFHDTPRHGRWLNMAEIDLSILQRQWLTRRSADEATHRREVAAWEQQRNKTQNTIDWRFSVTDAREKLKRLYSTSSGR